MWLLNLLLNNKHSCNWNFWILKTIDAIATSTGCCYCILVLLFGSVATSVIVFLYFSICCHIADSLLHCFAKVCTASTSGATTCQCCHHCCQMIVTSLIFLLLPVCCTSNLNACSMAIALSVQLSWPVAVTCAPLTVANRIAGCHHHRLTVAALVCTVETVLSLAWQGLPPTPVVPPTVKQKVALTPTARTMVKTPITPPMQNIPPYSCNLPTNLGYCWRFATYASQCNCLCSPN